MINPLSVEAIRQGFYLKEPDDHTLELWLERRLVARFYQTGVTIEGIEHEISEVMLNERRN